MAEHIPTPLTNGALADLMAGLSQRLRACADDPDVAFDAILGELATAFGADQAIASKNGSANPWGTRQITTGNDGSSLLIFPINGGHLAFVRQPDKRPFTVAEEMDLSSTLHAIEPALGLLTKNRDLQNLYRTTIEALAAAIEAKDGYTLGHSRRVSQFSTAIGQQLGLSLKECHELEIAALMHDLGKIGTSEAILRKRDKLTPEEYEHVKLHPDLTKMILQPVQLPDHILEGAVQHHERLDGSGYPFGAIGPKVSLFGRVIAVADVFDALTNDRPYRLAMTQCQALQIINDGRDKCFDGKVIDALVAVLDQPSTLNIRR